MDTGGTKRIQPHDALIRAVLSNPANAGSVLRSFLPARVLDGLDLEHLELQSGTFITDELRNRHTDVLFRTTIRTEDSKPGDQTEQSAVEDDAYLYYLIEHQSTPEALMAHRMLAYQIHIRDRHLAHHGGTTVPVVIPIVIYQGHDPWNAPTEVADITAADEHLAATLGDYLPRARYYLDDLTRLDDHALRARQLTPTLRIVHVSLRRGPGDPDFTIWLPDWRPEILRLSDQTLSMLVSYLMYVGNTPRDKLAAFAATTGPHTEEIIMTAAGRIVTEAEARGRAEGEAQLLLNLLTTRYGTLDPDVRGRIENATTDDIELWATRFAQGTATLNDIFV